MKFKSVVIAVTAASAMALLGAPAASAAPTGGIDGGCKATASLDKLGRPTATSRCSGRFPSGAAHRAVITCDIVQGAREHVVRRTFRSDWATTGSAVSVGCGFKAFLVGASSEVKGA
ncbi:hypothetical protein ACIPW5_12590 [Streptomyces sp. NPDC090077]|uniref:hypothetical protein n=1 Tax=Streptomyces sp. NPDC090077 TaxID=3365938 RepID=UPI003819ADB1